MERAQSMMKWAWLLLPFATLGFAVSILFDWPNRRLGSGAALAIVASAPFVVWLAVSALRHARHALATMWDSLHGGHGLWFLTFLSMLVFRVRDVHEISENPLDGWALFRVAIEGIVALALLTHLALHRTEWLGSVFRGLVTFLAVYGLVSLASTAWSVFPTWTLYKSIEYLIDVAVLAFILATVNSSNEYRALLNWTWCLYGLLICTVWIGAVVDPQNALHSKGFDVGMIGIQLRGVLPALSANDVGTFSALLAVISLARLLPITGSTTGRAWYFLLFLISTATMICSQTRSAIAGLLFAAFLMLIYSRRYAMSALAGFFLTPLLLLTSLGTIFWTFLQRGQTETQFQSMSSRANWWAFGWEKFLEQPLTGFGAYAGGRFAVLANLGLGGTSTMHSDYLEVIVGTGFWGLFPFLLALIGTWWYLSRTLWRLDADPATLQMAYESIAVLGLLTVRSVFMTMLTWHAPLHFLAVLGLAEVLRRQQLENEAQARAPVPAVGQPRFSPLKT